MCYWPSTADTDGIARNNERWRELLAFKFVRRRLDHVEDAIDERFIVARSDYLAGRSLLLEIHFQYRIHQLIWRKAILVELVGGKLGAGAFIDDLIGNYLATGRAIDLSSDLPNFGFQ